MKKSNAYNLPLLLITCLFFMWGFAHNLNPILIPHLKKACQLSDLESALIDSSFFLAYFIMAIPAGMYISKFGYKNGIVLGLLIFAFGAFMFYPAANTRIFIFFLAALFIIASGLTFLETAANPYVTVLGPPETATQRLNLAQSFNGLAASLAPLIGGKYILTGHVLSAETQKAMSPDALKNYLDTEATSVQIPYIVIGVFVLIVSLIIYNTKLPEIQEEKTESGSSDGILKQKNLIMGIFAQFFYVGAQVCVSSFFIRFLGKTSGILEKEAANYLAFALFCFMIGRFLGTYLMRFIKPFKLLALYAAINFVLLLLAVTLGGKIAIFSLIGVEFFMSIMFPTIFSLGIQGLGKQTKLGSSLIIMAISGGAIIPVIMGRISDISSIQTAYIVPAICFLVVLFFALNTSSKNKIEIIKNH